MKKRLDLCVMEKRGFSRTYAHEVIKCGLVLINNIQVKKPGAMVFPDEITINAPNMPFVSRGGFKLDHALKTFGITVENLVCLDIGASTGGFTDCLLKRGAKTVYAVDIGRNQLAESLRGNSGVVSLEGVDIRGLSLPEPVDFAVCDVSFISLGKIIPGVTSLLKLSGGFICLIKPQFETERRNLSKKGIVRDKNVRENAVQNVRKALEINGFVVKNLIESPITGGDGNVEFLIYTVNTGDNNTK
jgi:23S rRNA (cytidine1920-2'-O)/16S rRNA (cytidine1409-2'-O)-methyltransferase